MVRVLVVLVAANLVLSGLVFVLVVAQGTSEESASERSPRSAALSVGPGRAEIAALRTDVRSLEDEVRSVSRDVETLESRVREVLRAVRAEAGLAGSSPESAAGRALPLDGTDDRGSPAFEERAAEEDERASAGSGSEPVEQTLRRSGGRGESTRSPPPIDDRHLDREFSGLREVNEGTGAPEEAGGEGGDPGNDG